MGSEDSGRRLQRQVLHSAFLPQLTQALLVRGQFKSFVEENELEVRFFLTYAISISHSKASSAVLRTKALDLVLVLAQQLELVLV